jgi:N-acetylglucosaminyl-diphospho-decaprenol L-rhamnosyltransferase
MSRPFKHLIMTRFNIHLYDPQTQVGMEPDAWMEHRLRLFEAFTLPSLASQSCRDFRWRIAMDPRTRDVHVQAMERLCLANMELVFPVPGVDAWLADTPAGPYDLLTTRIDNDDAFHRDAVAALHETYRRNAESLARPWVMVFPFGMIFDLCQRQGWLMEYWVNNCPTLVADGRGRQTVWEWQHDQIPPEVPRRPIEEMPYWLQIVHGHNLRNAVHSANPLRKVHKDVPMKAEHLRLFGANPDRLPAP